MAQMLDAPTDGEVSQRNGRMFGTIRAMGPKAAEQGEAIQSLREWPSIRWVWGILTAKPMRPKSPTGSVMIADVVWEWMDGWKCWGWRGKVTATGRATQEGN